MKAAPTAPGSGPRTRAAAAPALILALPALGLAGCSFFTRSTPTPPVYVLRLPAPAAPAGAAAPAPAAADASGQGPAAAAAASAPTLRLMRPLPAPGLDTDRIAVLQPDARLDYYASGRWGANLPDVVADLALGALRGSGAWSAVVDPRAAFNTDYVLQIVVRRFEAEYGPEQPAPVAQVSLECLLTRRLDGKLVASFETAGSAPAAGNRMSAVVAAFGSAADAALTRLAASAAQAAQNADRPVASMAR